MSGVLADHRAAPQEENGASQYFDCECSYIKTLSIDSMDIAILRCNISD